MKVSTTPILAATGMITPVAAIYLPASIAAIGTLAAIGVVAIALAQRRWLALPSVPLILVLVALFVWSLLSALWSIRPEESLTRAIQVFAIGIAGTVLLCSTEVLDQNDRRWIGRAVAFGVMVAISICLAERASDFALRRLVEPYWIPRPDSYNRGATVLSLFMWPAALGLYRIRQPAVATGLLAAVGVAVFGLESASAKLGWLVGLGTMAFVYFTRRAGFRTIAVVTCAFIFLAPLIVRVMPNPDPLDFTRRLSSSAAHRLVMWHFTVDRISERPWLGWGLDSARNLPNARQEILWSKATELSPDGHQLVMVTLMPLHPHNMPLQLWLELGLAGAILGAGVVLVIARWIERRASNRTDRAILSGLFAASISMASISYGAWQSWWLMALWIVASISATLGKTPTESPVPPVSPAHGTGPDTL